MNEGRREKRHMTRPESHDHGEVILYRTEDGRTALDVRFAGETVWLTQAQMVDLFEWERSGITKHTRNVFAERELKVKGNVQKMHIANSDKLVAFYYPLDEWILPEQA